MSAPPRKPRTWIVVLLIVVAVYVFWILPAQLGPRHVKVEFQSASQPK